MPIISDGCMNTIGSLSLDAYSARVKLRETLYDGGMWSKMSASCSFCELSTFMVIWRRCIWLRVQACR